MRTGLLLALGLVAVGVLSLPSRAVKMRRPFSQSIGVNYGFDHNYSAAGCRDYGCGTVCYDGHTGTDFPLPLGTQILAAAAGRVTATYNGCANYGSLGNTCGGRCGNYVRVDHLDGTVTLYCHMQLNSIVVSVNQNVSCGQLLGNSASSGSSTGPHLHLGYRLNGTNIDPFAGSCSQATSYWVSQGSYPRPIPSTDCSTTCQCTPGQTQSQGCGNCGTQSRTCGSNCMWGSWGTCSGQGSCSPGQTQTQGCGNCGSQSRTCTSSCQWGSWSTCAGQGVCSPGTTQTQDCCDCGTQSRTCSGSCQWPSWSTCSGPDPDGGQGVCDTGETGLCAEGRLRCHLGCLSCVRVYEPQPERCDMTDNDCNGLVDDGFPEVMGDPPPPVAARLVDIGVPLSARPGERITGWAAFENVGAHAWTAGTLWLEILPETLPETVHWMDDTWSAYNVPGRLNHDVSPGQRGLFEFAFVVPENAGPRLNAEMQLVSSIHGPVNCPAPLAQLHIPLHPGQNHIPGIPVIIANPDSGEGCSCTTGRHSTLPAWWFLLLPGLVVWRRRRLRAPKGETP